MKTASDFKYGQQVTVGRDVGRVVSTSDRWVFVQFGGCLPVPCDPDWLSLYTTD